LIFRGTSVKTENGGIKASVPYEVLRPDKMALGFKEYITGIILHMQGSGFYDKLLIKHTFYFRYVF
jgi:hypothetical protein